MRRYTSTDPGLLFAEEALNVIRGVLRDTPLWDEMRVEANGVLRPSVLLRDALPMAEVGKEPWKAYLSEFWDFDPKAPRMPCGPSEPAPLGFELRTEDRLAFAAHLPLIAQTFEGKPVSLWESRSWRWDHDVKQSDGSATHHTVYVLSIGLKGKSPFESKPWLQSTLPICLSKDERADQCVFQMERALLGKNRCSSYEPTASGFRLGYYTKEEARQGTQAVFADCDVAIKPGKDESEFIVAEVTFPDCREMAGKKRKGRSKSGAA